MAYRATRKMVEKIVDVPADADVSPFIEAANMMVNDNCLTSGYTGEQLRVIEVWLAAHFYCILDPRARFEGVGKLQQSIESKVDLGLDVTRYGQMAMRLDKAGNLAKLNARMISDNAIKSATKLGIGWVGKDRGE